MSNHRSKIVVLMLLVCTIYSQTSCQKFIQIDPPPDKITESNIFSNDKTAISVMTGLYTSIVSSSADLSEFSGLLADELVLWNDADDERRAYYTNSLEANRSKNTGKQLWITYFNFIFRCNAVLEGVENNNRLSDRVKTQLKGEALFLRSWLNFYLVNLYGEIPIVVSTNPEENRLLPRSSIDAVYKLIIEDLIMSSKLLSADFLNGKLNAYNSGAEERVRPTLWAAKALLARVYLFNKKWSEAELTANEVIAHRDLFSLSDLVSIFHKNNKESIWLLQPIESGWNTSEGRRFNLNAFPQGFSIDKPVYLSDFLLNVFEKGDKRREKFVDSLIIDADTFYFSSKYKEGAFNSNVTDITSLTEYTVVFRLSELYLIRAEARTFLGNISAAISDLDSIRKRSSLDEISKINPNISQMDLVSAILHERQVELFLEWGHRWLDLKRLGRVDDVMKVVAPAKGGQWQLTDQLLPIPFEDLLYNSQLSQNLGY